MIILLCLGYLALQLVHAARTEFNPDEIQGAIAVHRLQTELPYLDFRPYKTVLGYYLQYPVLRFSDDPWTCLILLRGELAVINTCVLLGASLFLARRYRPEAVCLALLFLVTMSTFLERSSEIRSDMLSAWCGLAGLLLLLDRRFLLAGIACGMSFFISQKGAYYILAGDVALAGWLISHRTRFALVRSIRFNLAMLGVLLAYLSFWSLLSSPSAVVKAIFFSHQDIAFSRIYEIPGYWFQTLRRNPFFYLIGFVGLCQMLAALLLRSAGYHRQVLSIYALTLTALCIWHKQPWPYFFVMLIPTAFVVHVTFFQNRIEELSRFRSGRARAGVVACLILAAMIPLARLRVTFRGDNAFQRETFRLIDACLDNHETYVDGMDLCYHRRQTVSPLRWLDRAQLGRLAALTPEGSRDLLKQLDEAPVKMVVDNWRIRSLPEPIKDHLFSSYDRLWGNVCVYSPSLPPGSSEITLKFAGAYEIDGPEHEPIWINDKPYVTGDRLTLRPGAIGYGCRSTFRLKLQPAGWEALVESPEVRPRPGFMAFHYGR